MAKSQLLGLGRWLLVAGVSAVAIGGAVSACGSSGDLAARKSGAQDNGGDSTGGAAGASTGGGGAGPSGGSSSGGTAGTGFMVSMGGGPTDAASEACASSQYEGEPMPLDIYIMFDQSGSMNESTGSGGGMMGGGPGGGGGASSKWNVIKNALNTFMGDPASAGIGLGIQYFPLGLQGAMACSNLSCVGCSQPMNLPMDCQCLNLFIGYVCASTAQGSCNVMDYQVPDVPIAPLPGVSAAMMTSLNNHGPGGLTPTEPAVAGALAYVKTWAQQNQTHKTVFVLATDGDPTGCDMNTNTANSIAANVIAPAFMPTDGTPPIETFVIGVGNSLTSLNAMAAAGGTTQALIVDTTMDAGAQFLAAMRKIRGSSLACEFSLPSAGASGKLDYTKINVQYTADGTLTAVGYATGPSDCDATLGGWYFDDANNPTQILLCPATCSQASLAVSVKLDVLVGCERVPVHVPK